MANPLPNEDRLYEYIRQEGITIHPVLRELINHHIRNDLNGVSTSMGQYELMPPWILKAASWVVNTLYKLSRQPGEPPPDILAISKETMERNRAIADFLNRIMAATRPPSKA